MKDIKRKYSFSDIEFKPYFTEEEVNFIKKLKLMKDVDKYMQGVVEFENGYGVSVLLGQLFHSDGEDTYEVSVTYDGHIINRYNEQWVECFLNRDEVEKLMNNVALSFCSIIESSAIRPILLNLLPGFLQPLWDGGLQNSGGKTGSFRNRAGLSD